MGVPAAGFCRPHVPELAPARPDRPAPRAHAGLASWGRFVQLPQGLCCAPISLTSLDKGAAILAGPWYGRPCCALLIGGPAPARPLLERRRQHTHTMSSTPSRCAAVAGRSLLTRSRPAVRASFWTPARVQVHVAGSVRLASTVPVVEKKQSKSWTRCAPAARVLTRRFARRQTRKSAW